LEVIKEGFKLPMKALPEKKSLKKNKSAQENRICVLEEIRKLFVKGCITEVTNASHVVNTLTVAFSWSGKPVLDCRHVNLDLFKYKCTFEDTDYCLLEITCSHLF
jgi:hypothetical protein